MPPRRSTTRSQKKNKPLLLTKMMLSELQDPVVEDYEHTHDDDQQTMVPASKTNKHQTATPVPKTAVKHESQFNESAINIGCEPLAPITNINDKIHKGTLDEKIESYVKVNKIRNDGSNETSKSYFRLSLNTTPCSNHPNNTYSFSRTFANTFNIISPNFNSSTLASGVSQMPKQKDMVKANRDFLKELKCLFLRVQEKRFQGFANRNFSDFQNKFLDSVEEAIEIFKEKRLRVNKDTTACSLDENEIISFVNENLTLNILQSWLSMTNMTKLRDQNSLHVLQRFVQGSLIVNYD
ncbi:13077_t:CDS:2 [Rhizophagus irregularis]|nr:13077_t:CDS:2 [Rhizophagus irregularis]